MEPVGVGTGLCWRRGHRSLHEAWDMGSEEAAGLCQDSRCRRGQQFSLLASRIKGRLKTRCSHHCSRADCWPPCLEYFPLPVLLQGREVSFRHIYTLKHRGSGRTRQTNHVVSILSRLKAGEEVTQAREALTCSLMSPSYHGRAGRDASIVKSGLQTGANSVT